jgi:hypothetical protein
MKLTVDVGMANPEKTKEVPNRRGTEGKGRGQAVHRKRAEEKIVPSVDRQTPNLRQQGQPGHSL